ncbi:YciI family protein [Luteipulveratus mongoliensis]|uniref:YCII-related domain-containing protein n=1 Tax=Luteipulveratus mongoliensis TaxID=571913 RepID=A0A0K1JDG1_9MICO|nr:YciI family protein [Luteipulveratus mongoliensis]AKU14645.1 hypothetical protein VV02_00125 [Luteipulveratus mongoliensis]
MTQYLLAVMGRQGDPERSEPDTQEAYGSVAAFNEKLAEAGAWVFGGGLEPVTQASVVDGTGVDVVTTDGPFGESKEFLGGFWIIEAADLEAARRIAGEASKACGGPVEVRAFDGDEDVDRLNASASKG